VEQVMAATAARLDENAPGRSGDTVLPSPATGALSTKNKHHYAGHEWTSEHPLNIRMSIPLIFGRYYITVVAGKERRARARLALDKRQHPLDTPGNVVFLFLIGVIAAAGSVTVGYMLLAHLLGWSGRLVL
jgi:hypothetical protein